MTQEGANFPADATGAPALSNGIDVLRQLVREPAGLSLTEVARRLDLPKSSAWRLLSTLQAVGYVAVDAAGRRYTADLRILELASELLSRMDVRTRAAPYLHDLAVRTGLVAVLGVVSGDAVVTIDRVSLARFGNQRGSIGARTPAVVSSIGRAIIAFAPADDVQRMVGAHQLRRYTPSTITDRAALLAELEATRARGYAMNNEEWIARVRSIGAPIRNHAGQVIAGVAVSNSSLYPAEAGDGADGMRRHLPLLLEASESISYSLGFHAALAAPTHDALVGVA